MQTYAHVQTMIRPAILPSRFAALDSLFSKVTNAGVVLRREAIPHDSGLDTISIISEQGDDVFFIYRINADTFMIRKVTKSSK